MREEDKLVRRMAAGDEAAAEALVARYYAEILRYCRWLDDVPLENAPDPICEDANFAEAQSRAALRELVRTLPETQREIVLLRFAQDLTLREIAEITELPLRTVQSRLRAALKNLRTIYEKEAER